MADDRQAPARAYDLVVYGATGFTGRLVAEHLLASYGVGGEISWAMAGRSAGKLAEVRDLIGAPASLPLITANAADPASLQVLANSAKVIVTTVGPYQLYGEGLVAACAAAGTDYVDLCGEPAWMAAMIGKYGNAAQASGARIVFSCGFDSIPFDLGVFFLERQAQAKFGVPAVRVRGRVRKMKGSFSGGTAASLLATVEAAAREPSILKTLADPFALTPGFVGAAQPGGADVVEDKAAGSWAAPFMMAMINTKAVHRSNHLLGDAYGRDFVYDEMMMTGSGAAGEKRARAMARREAIQNALIGFAPTRALIRRFVLPKPGQGPSKAARDSGYYDILFIGETADGKSLRVSVKGDRDPGYGSTSKMIAESGICLARDISHDAVGGGFWTTASAMGDKLINRLQAKAGLTFTLENG
ncbi:MAG: saccharopine dehydrogenase family protein [Xanthobacteraceae bacterium]|jgi:short subunit dehydrogenase-like uncharacterized protein